MSRSSISVRGIGKLYSVNELRHRLTLTERLGKLLKKPFSLSTPSEDGSTVPERIWALRDVSFDLEEGRILGVLGKNGSGKSTLLKILARITSPTEGTAVLYGRVGALLEVGTGFHPDLSGRENILLNGTIIGMTPKEIHAREEEIVAFSEVEQFIDTPIRHYSSGMFMRLAFAVAAHLDAEIMLVDEVLAVGDAAFQEKCKRKIREIASSGRTILFTSHDMAAVRNICHQTLVLHRGQITHFGDVETGIELYGSLAAQN